MLDTNTASYVIKGNPSSVREKLLTVPMEDVHISAITEAELLSGVAKKPDAKHLPVIVKEFLLRVDILAWDSYAAKAYSHFTAVCHKDGKSLGMMDMLIASHSIATNTVLVTNDKAFYKLSGHLNLEDWVK